MLVKYHIFLGFIFSVLLFLIFPDIKFLEALLIFLSSVLIDADHYIYYIFKKKTFNLKKAYSHLLNSRKKRGKLSSKQRDRYYSGWCFLHGIEILAILFILGIFVSEYFLLIFIGFTFHLFLDLIEEIYWGWRIDKISVIYDYFKFKKLKLIE